MAIRVPFNHRSRGNLTFSDDSKSASGGRKGQFSRLSTAFDGGESHCARSKLARAIRSGVSTAAIDASGRKEKMSTASADEDQRSQTKIEILIATGDAKQTFVTMASVLGRTSANHISTLA